MSFGVWHKVRNKKNKEGVSYDPSDVYRLYAEEWNDAHDAFGILCGYAFKFSSTIVTGNASWQELSDVTITLDLPKSIIFAHCWVFCRSPSGVGQRNHFIDIAVDDIPILGDSYAPATSTRDEEHNRSKIGSISIIKEVEAGTHKVAVLYWGDSGGEAVRYGLVVLAFSRP